MKTQSRRFIASRKTCIATSPHRVGVKGPLVFTLHAIKPFFLHYQICMCVVKLETCPMRAIIAAIVALRAATRHVKKSLKHTMFFFFRYLQNNGKNLDSSSTCFKTFGCRTFLYKCMCLQI